MPETLDPCDGRNPGPPSSAATITTRDEWVKYVLSNRIVWAEEYRNDTAAQGGDGPSERGPVTPWAINELPDNPEYQYDECLADDEGCLLRPAANAAASSGIRHHDSDRAKAQKLPVGQVEAEQNPIIITTSHDD